jgi:hypothetical protein
VIWIVKVLGAAAAAVALWWIGKKFWDTIREKVAEWLRKHGWERSILMDAWIRLDSLVGAVRSKIFVKTKQTGEVMISETTYSIEDIDDPEVCSELEKRGHVTKNIMEYIE